MQKKQSSEDIFSWPRRYRVKTTIFVSNHWNPFQPVREQNTHTHTQPAIYIYIYIYSHEGCTKTSEFLTDFGFVAQLSHLWGPQMHRIKLVFISLTRSASCVGTKKFADDSTLWVKLGTFGTNLGGNYTHLVKFHVSFLPCS